MQTPKKDWTQQERDRFEKVVCCLFAINPKWDLSEMFKDAIYIINKLDKFYNEQSTNNN